MNSQHNQARTTTLLLILDGYGLREKSEFNAIHNAKTPNFDHLWQNCGQAIQASGEDVGLPSGQMGNSEVGHMNIGAGRIVYQDFTRISKAIADGEFTCNPVINHGLKQAVSQGKAVHILGLLSPGGVHSHEDHIRALVDLSAKIGVKQIHVHAFLDGRDTPPKSAQPSITALEKQCKALSNESQSVSIASICGRFYAMDRDQRWDRVASAFNGIMHGQFSAQAASAHDGLHIAYQQDLTDEFVPMTQTDENYQGIQEDDVVIFANFRSDRAQELSAALSNPTFNDFDRGQPAKLGNFITMTQYSSTLKAQVAFPSSNPDNTLGEVLAQQQIPQLRLAETEKYAHVTFFMNAGRDEPFPLESRVLIPSPKVRTYDLAPAMSLTELTLQLCNAIETGEYGLIICNFANADMVGHTGDYDAAILAIEAIDKSLEQVVQSLKRVNGQALITADHGNAELMQDSHTGQPHTAHTNQPVPLIYVGPRPVQWQTVANPRLSDLAPTLLYLMNIEQPPQMTGRCLLKVL